MQHKSEPTEESPVYVVYEVSGEDDDAREPLDVVEEHTHVHIGIAVCGGAGDGRGGGGGGGGEGHERGKGRDGERDRRRRWSEIKWHLISKQLLHVHKPQSYVLCEEDHISLLSPMLPHAIHTNIPHGSPGSEQPLCLIKDQDGIRVACLLEDGINVLCALSHPLTQQFSTVHHLEVQRIV